MTIRFVSTELPFPKLKMPVDAWLKPFSYLTVVGPVKAWIEAIGSEGWETFEGAEMKLASTLDGPRAERRNPMRLRRQREQLMDCLVDALTAVVAKGFVVSFSRNSFLQPAWSAA